MRQNVCNISSISKDRNDFTHRQLKDYDVFSVKKLEIRPTEKTASKIPKVRGGSEAFGKNEKVPRKLQKRGGFRKKLIFKPPDSG